MIALSKLIIAAGLAGACLQPNMLMRYEELDYRQTELGELILRVRESVSQPGSMIYEVKLDGEFLMSSLVRQSEIALADLALERLRAGPLNVLVGGLGLGYTAAAALRHDAVDRVDVIEYLEPVIDWHRKRLVPAAGQLMADARCRLIHGDFFDHVAQLPDDSRPRYDAILVDIDHSPESLLHARHGRFYTEEGLKRLSMHLRPDGVLGLWSADLPGRGFIQSLEGVFGSVQIREISFYAPHLRCRDSNWILLASA
jgi:spermidine synthase